jgi:hypothetical protein
MPSSRLTSGTVAPAPSLASAWRSLRTICSGVCWVFFTESPPHAPWGLLDSHSNWISFRGAGHAEVNVRRRVASGVATRSSKCTALYATSATVEPEASLPSASRSLRTICSCEYPLPNFEGLPCSAHHGHPDSHRNWTDSGDRVRPARGGSGSHPFTRFTGLG